MGMKIIYYDETIVVVEKPGGLLAVPGRDPENQDCVSSRIQDKFANCIPQPAVHRLDMDTSGLMVLAFTKEAHRNISIQFQERLVKKIYIALLDGLVINDSGEIRLPFRLDVDNRPRQIYDPIQGKIGLSKWQKVNEKSGKTRIQFTPITGRTHQLRVHAAHPLGLGCPIVGDPLYGRGKSGEQMMLHAFSLRFKHPQTGKEMTFESIVPF